MGMSSLSDVVKLSFGLGDRIPVVHPNSSGISDAFLKELQDLTSSFVVRAKRNDIVSCGINGLYIVKGSAEPHQDHAPAGCLASGIVIRSEGHRLHSRRLDAAGVREGLPLNVGDVYQHDPHDEHWTSVPDNAKDAVLAFYVEGDPPDSRSIAEIAHDLISNLQVEMP